MTHNVETEDGFTSLLELAANNDLASFKSCVDRDSSKIEEVELWYGRENGTNKMVLQHRTPLMVAATYGSIDVLKWILSFPGVDVNRLCGDDNTTALHCATSGGAVNTSDVVKLLLEAGADPNLVDANGFCPLESSADHPKIPNMKHSLQDMLNMDAPLDEGRNQSILVDILDPNLASLSPTRENGSPLYPTGSLPERKEYPIDPSLPDIKNSIYSTDEFRMFSFKVRPCSRAYSHDWTECPFVHPGENARRRDPRKFHYSCVPCPDFRKGACRRGDMCEYAHGVFECWLHPAQYRTRLCKDGTGCNRRVCFFAHLKEELRPLYISTGSAVPSPHSMDYAAAMSGLPGSPSSVHMMPPSPFTPPMSPAGNGISPNAGWLPQQNVPALHLPCSNLQSSRLRSSFNARDIPQEDLGMFQDMDNQQQQILHELSLMSQYNRTARPKTLNASNLDDIFSAESSSPRYSDLSLASVVFSPTHKSAVLNQFQQQQSMLSPIKTNFSPRTMDQSQLQASYGLPSPGRSMSPRGVEPISPMSARMSMLVQRENHNQKLRSLSSRDLGANAAAAVTSLEESWSNWGPANGTPDWAVTGEEFGKIRRSSSFELLSEEPDLSWVHSLVKESSQDVTDKSASRVVEDSGIGTRPCEEKVLNDEIEQVNPSGLGAWIEKMQLDQLMA